MAINSIAMNAYRTALGQAQGSARSAESTVSQGLGKTGGAQKSGFMDALKNSVGEVNAEQLKKDQMVSSFATGENQNVHELMIQLQKAGLAMSMTSTVRNKVLDMYKELVKMPF
ncbi:flagellar hook-basal body complex protein FliE [Fundidesulfovibrio agrisoli]|uniref:flagellar hook-basal body complex protein FliE n=1 Tax=Fundidesulfovibrio agrisoli TaxID=2922717 RepID=UPI001FAD8B8E|nr:flagellar hook-basal body complex protein FliE [Fundidesulfovibrio agrisoli]